VRKSLLGHPTLWINCASGGELIQVFSLCRRLRNAIPEVRLVLSTNNYHSFQFAKRIPGVDHLCFAPWDLPGPCRRVLRAIRPALVLTVELPSSPVLLREAKAQGITTALLSGYMGTDYHRHPAYDRPMALGVLAHLDCLAVKDPGDAEGFIRLGVSPARIRVAGDLRYDLELLHLSTQDRQRLRESFGLAEGEPVLVAGSTQRGEHEVVLEAYAQARRTIPRLRLILAPRFLPEVAAVEDHLEKRGTSWVRRTQLAGGALPPDAVVLLDTFGELPRVYALASFVFLGGGLYPQDRLGLGQNLIEPLAQAVPIFFGPHMNHWQEITRALLAVYPGLEVRGAEAIASGLTQLSRRPDIVDRLRETCRVFMARKQGSLDHHLAFLQEILKGRPA
jgi:3-deoxy-D-manno-octulosonic-acid transferase